MLIPTNKIILPPRLFAPAAYYALIAAAESVTIDSSLRFDKRQKAVHRYDIADTRGRLQLTVPIVKPHGCPHSPTWADAGISPHGEWWRLHITALESAYGRTPYFEFVIDKFSGIFINPDEPDAAPNVLELCKRADEIVRQILAIETPVEWIPAENLKLQTDLRCFDPSTNPMETHFQIRSSQLGFIQHLSILDLIFNLGPEAILYIDRMAAHLHLQTQTCHTQSHS